MNESIGEHFSTTDNHGNICYKCKLKVRGSRVESWTKTIGIHFTGISPASPDPHTRSGYTAPSTEEVLYFLSGWWKFSQQYGLMMKGLLSSASYQR